MDENFKMSDFPTNAWIDELMSLVRNQANGDRLKQLLSHPHCWPPVDVARLLQELSTAGQDAAAGQTANISPVIDALGQWFRQFSLDTPNRDEFYLSIAPALNRWYAKLPGASPLRRHLLSWLAVLGSPAALAQFAQWLADDPPTASEGVAQIFEPLLGDRPTPIETLFPTILAALAHRVLAASILDVANHYFRAGQVDAHPAAERLSQLLLLLDGVVCQVENIENGKLPNGMTQAALLESVADSVSLTVALCDALALIGDRSAVGGLSRALELKHRRIQTEAAAALARLQEPRGADKLVALASQPVARLRVLAYADELELSEKIDVKYRTEEAVAEGELAVWLSEPSRFGIAPVRLELFDSRTLYWPGFDDVQSCYLFRYVYPKAGGETANIGIARPCTHAIGPSLLDYTPLDIYALFAGWQGSHDEVFEIDVERLSASSKRTAQQLART